MNALGYQKLQAGYVQEAIELFKLNVKAYSEASNTYDSLGEAHMVNGDKELAIKNYKKSLELNPDNQNAVEKLKQLE
jgi:tetratricopeptide (TPR) repeat protein